MGIILIPHLALTGDDSMSMVDIAAYILKLHSLSQGKTIEVEIDGKIIKMAAPRSRLNWLRGMLSTGETPIFRGSFKATNQPFYKLRGIEEEYLKLKRHQVKVRSEELRRLQATKPIEMGGQSVTKLYENANWEVKRRIRVL